MAEETKVQAQGPILGAIGNAAGTIDSVRKWSVFAVAMLVFLTQVFAFMTGKSNVAPITPPVIPQAQSQPFVLVVPINGTPPVQTLPVATAK